MADADLALKTEMSLSEQRALMDTDLPMLFDTLDKIYRVTDVKVLGAACDIPVRVYQPSEEAPSQVLVYFHGGGFTMGSIKSHDAVCRRLTSTSQALVASVEYRLAPEDPYPAGLDDCCTAAQWVYEHAPELGVRPGRFSFGVAGDSAGANLAACLALRARETSFPCLDYQILICPVLRHIFEPLTGSHLDFKDGPVVTAESGLASLCAYLGDVDKYSRDPAIFPLEAADLSGLPPALVIVSDRDILRDDGVLYAERLQEAGVDAQLQEFETGHVMMIYAPNANPDMSQRSYQAIADFMQGH